MADPAQITVSEIELEGGEKVAFASLPIEPYGEALLATSPVTPASVEMLVGLGRDWGRVWPEMRPQLEQLIQEWGGRFKLGEDAFSMAVDPLDPPFFMSDKADRVLHVEFEADDSIEFAFFLKGSTIVGAQADE